MFWHVTNNSALSVQTARQLSCKQTQNCYKNWLPCFSSEAIWACAVHISSTWSGSEGAYFCTVVWYFLWHYVSLLHINLLLLRYLTFKWWPWCIVLAFNSSCTAGLNDTHMVLMFRILFSWAVVWIWTSTSLKG